MSVRAEKITVLGRKTYRDILDDDDTAAPGESFSVDGCKIWPRTSAEEGQGEIVIGGFNVFTPPQADVRANDKIIIRGQRHEIITDPTLGLYVNKGKLFQTQTVTRSGGEDPVGDDL